MTLFNPLTYASEGMRAALVPGVPHIRTWVCLALLVVASAVFMATGLRGFRRRAVD